ncbi:MAG: amino acid synthesis family protein [Alphaproteobacteria bacterium]|nr:amino acid synthesis family protein [Alphaproteobacteria bacterium]
MPVPTSVNDRISDAIEAAIGARAAIHCRKLVVTAETVLSEQGKVGATPVTRVAAMAAFTNPFAGRHVEDLTVLFDVSRILGEHLSAVAAEHLMGPAVSYGKAAIVGSLGEFEHGAAVLHPKLGKPMRDVVGGGEALIPSNVKIAAPGATIDVPLGHKDKAWSFDHFDTMSVAVADSPRPDEILMIVALADGGRINPRSGDKPITD